VKYRLLAALMITIAILGTSGCFEKKECEATQKQIQACADDTTKCSNCSR
jgi:hypothetical protein